MGHDAEQFDMIDQQNYMDHLDRLLFKLLEPFQGKAEK